MRKFLRRNFELLTGAAIGLAIGNAIMFDILGMERINVIIFANIVTILLGIFFIRWHHEEG